MSQLAEQDDEIDLGELFATIWYNWWILGLFTIFSLVVAGVYTFYVATPVYKASTRFELLEIDNGGVAFGQAADLAALAGLNLPNSASEADSIEDRILSRPFVDSIYEEAGFENDPIFNETLLEPSLKKKLVASIFGPLVPEEVSRDDLLNFAIDALREKMEIKLGRNGIIELKISHPDSKKAADVANIIVKQTLQDIFERERNEARDTLDYFADELLKVRSDLDAANAAVRDYAISNSLQSAEELARVSSQLSQVRRDLDAIDDSILALERIEVGNFDGPDFALAYPVTTSLSFRRLLNFSGDPNSWIMPSSAEVDRALRRLKAQKSPLTSSLNALQARAMSSGAEALELAALEREVEVQQAIYTSVITQFEARSLISGYQRASGRVVEAAIAPKKPASPKKALVLILGAVLGAIIAVVVIIIATMKRGTLFTDSAIKRVFSSGDVRKRRPSELGRINRAELTPKQRAAVQDLLVSLNESQKVVSVVSARSNDRVARLAVSLSKVSAQLGVKTGLLDLSNGALERLTRNVDGVLGNAFSKYMIGPDIDLFIPVDTDYLLKPLEGERCLSNLKEEYDRVFVVLPSTRNGTAVSRMIAKSTDAPIIVAERGKITRGSVELINSIYSKSKVSDPLLVIV